MTVKKSSQQAPSRPAHRRRHFRMSASSFSPASSTPGRAWSRPLPGGHLFRAAKPASSVRAFKSLLTIYLLTAIVYTTSVVLIKPLFSTLFRFSFSLHSQPESQTHSSPLQTSSLQIIPRLLPLKAHLTSPAEVKIRTNLKGTSVNTEEVIAEDETSLWTSRPTELLSKSPPKDPERTSTRLSSWSPSLHPNSSSLETIDWHPPNHPLAGAKSSLISLPISARMDTHQTAEDFFLSKAFGESLGPSKVVPFFYRALGPNGTGELEKQDISITTLVTSNRFKVFAKLVEQYQGPISATIHVSDAPEILKPMLESLDELYHSSPSMSTWVDIHLVVDAFDRQFNMWRNVAKFFARTDLVMMLDVDFWLCTNFRRRILDSPRLLGQLLAGGSAFVVPAFEFTKQSDGTDVATFPTDKGGLMALVEKGKIGMFHKSWQPGHGPSDYARFYADTDETVYPAAGYTHSYEPYVVYKKDGTPFCDERFIGYGGNKAACLFELYLSGVTFFVLPKDFLIHQSHAYAEKTRQHERKFNRKLYTDFREEVCFRYLIQYLDEDGPASGKNMLTQCRKIKGFADTATRLGETYGLSIKVENALR